MAQESEVLTDDMIRYMCLDPEFNQGQNDRLNSFNELGKHVTHFYDVLNKIERISSDFLSCLGELGGALTPISDIIGSIQVLNDVTIINKFCDQIAIAKSSITSGISSDLLSLLREFEDLSLLDTIAKKAKHNWVDNLEKYLGDSNNAPKSKTKEIMEKHKVASITFFNSISKMELLNNTLPYTIHEVLHKLTSNLSTFANTMSCVMINKSSRQEEIDHQKLLTTFEKSRNDLKNSIAFRVPLFWELDVGGYVQLNVCNVCGFLWKKGKFGQWHKTVVKIENHEFMYTTIKGIFIPKSQWKSIDLLLCSVKKSSDQSRGNTFTIRTHEITYDFQALSSFDVQRWITVIERNITNTIQGFEESRQAQVTAVPCADCGFKEAQWIDVNWGLPICSQCSGIHRGLGTNFSRVRSTVLDKIPNYQKNLIDAINVEEANSMLSRKVAHPIDASASEAERSSFISQKYVLHSFAAEPQKEIINCIQSKDLMGVYANLAFGGTKRYSNKYPLHAAAARGNENVLSLIALNSENIDALDDCGWTPLMYAIINGHAGCVNILLQLGATTTASPKISASAIAAKFGNKDIMKMVPLREGEKPPDVDIIPPHKLPSWI